MNVQPKVKAAGAGAGTSGAVAILLIWVLSQVGVDVPPEAAAAISTVVASAGALVGGYVKAP